MSTDSPASSSSAWNTALRTVMTRLGVPLGSAEDVLRAGLWYAIFVGAITITKSGSNALFLARADAKLLPALYVIVALAVTVATSVLARFLTKYPSGRVVLVGPALGAVLLIASCLAAEFKLVGATGVLYVLGEVAATAGNVLFWARLADCLSAREQKRAVGFISAGGMIGSAIAGFGVVLLTQWISAAYLVVVAQLVVLLSMRLLVKMRDRAVEMPTANANTGASNHKLSLLDGMRYLALEKHPRAVAALVALFAALGAVTDFVFRTASLELKSEAEMANLFGILNGVVGIVVVFFQLFVTTRLLASVGIFLFLAIIPFLLFTSSVAALLWPQGFVLLVAIKGIEMAGAYSLNQAGISLLYNPLPHFVRSTVRTLIDGAIKKIGAAIAGVGLALVAQMFPQSIDVPLVCAGSLLTLLLLPLVRRSYLAALEYKLGVGRSQPLTTLDPQDPITRKILLKALRSDDAEHLLAALEALGRGYTLPPRRLLQLLNHADERVRLAALQRVPERRSTALAEILLRVIRLDAAAKPRAEALRAVYKILQDDAAFIVVPQLQSDVPALVCTAISLLSNMKDPKLQQQAQEKLDVLLKNLRHENAEWRRALVGLLGELGSRGEKKYDAILTQLIDDRDSSVAIYTIRAIARESHDDHIAPLLEHLHDPALHSEVEKAVSAYGDRAVPVLATLLDDQTKPLLQRTRIPKILAAIGTKTAAEALLFSNPRDDAFLQLRIAEALLNIIVVASAMELDQERLREAIQRRLEASRGWNALLRAGHLAVPPTSPQARRAERLLRRLIRERALQSLYVLLLLLCAYRDLDTRNMKRAFKLISEAIHRDDKSRSHNTVQDAVDFIDVGLAGSRWRNPVLAAVEEMLQESKIGVVHEQQDGQKDVEELLNEQFLWGHMLLRIVDARDPLLQALSRLALSSSDTLPPLLGIEELWSPSFDEEIGTASPETPSRAQQADAENIQNFAREPMDANVVERLFLLENVDLFEGLSVDDLTAIAHIATEMTVDPGSILYQEGDTDDTLYIVVSGNLLLTKQGRMVMRLTAGESAGQVSFLDQGPRPVRAQVASDAPARLLAVEREAFMELLTDRPSLMKAFLGVLAQRLRALIERTQR